MRTYYAEYDSCYQKMTVQSTPHGLGDARKIRANSISEARLIAKDIALSKKIDEELYDLANR